MCRYVILPSKAEVYSKPLDRIHQFLLIGLSQGNLLILNLNPLLRLVYDIIDLKIVHKGSMYSNEVGTIEFFFHFQQRGTDMSLLLASYDFAVSTSCRFDPSDVLLFKFDEFLPDFDEE